MDILNTIIGSIDSAISSIVGFLAFICLKGDNPFGGGWTIHIMGFPLLVFWLIFAAIFFTIKLKFVNIRLFTHAIDVARGKYKDDSAQGKLSPLEALFTSVSATVGLGNIAGVAVAVTIGGPGAIIWMMIAAFFAMSLKFSEVTLGLKYRSFDKNGHLKAGIFYYLEKGLKKHGKEKLGLVLAKIAALLFVLGGIGAGMIFQSNQATAMFVSTFSLGSLGKVIFVLILAGTVAFILFGGIARVGNVAAKLVPLMAIIYIISCFTILVINYSNIGVAIATMFKAAFLGSEVATGGIIGAMIAGFKRAAFSNEAGIGTSPTAHAASKTKEPVQEGTISLLEPFLDTIIICFMTGIVIVVTGVYQGEGTKGLNGVLLTKAAFVTVTPWFSYVLSLVVILFSFSTMLTYSYYCQQAWEYFSKSSNMKIAHSVFALSIIVGGLIRLDVVIDLADILFLSMAVPNVIGLFIMRNEIRDDTKAYIKKLKLNKL